MTKISIIMPVYNATKFLQKSIESITKQTLKDLELICVDDGSTDNSLDVLNKLSNKYNFIKIIKQENKGPGIARNTGIKHATGEYIAFLDADDIYIDINALEEMYNYSIKNNLNITSANLKFIEPDYSIQKNPHYKMGDYAYFNEYDIINPKDYGIPYAFYKNIFKKEFLIKNNISFPNLKTGEDPIFLAKIFSKISEIGVIPLTLYGYNHSIGGGVNLKVNTYEKKKDYIQHFKEVCDILSECGLDTTSDFYKIHLLRYLTWNNNIYSEEIFELFNDIYGIDNPSFDESDFNYIRFIVNAKFYFINKYDSEEFFKKTYNDFLNLDIYGAFAITKEIFDKYYLVVYSKSYDKFKINYENFLNDELEFKRKFTIFKISSLLNNTNTSEDKNIYKNIGTSLDKKDNNKLFKLYNNLFQIYIDSFGNTLFSYSKFNLIVKFYLINKYDSEEFFLKVNKEFLTFNVYEIPSITEDILDKYYLVVYSYTFDKFKSNYNKYLNNNLKIKNELRELKVKKFIFNLDISDSPIIFENSKKIILNNPIGSNAKVTKQVLKKGYTIIQNEKINEYKENLIK